MKVETLESRTSDQLPGEMAVQWLLADLRARLPSSPRRKPGSNYDKILVAARDTLKDVGYASFALREVASRAQVHLKTLQYHFKTKGSLIEETLNYSLTRHYYDSYISLFNSLQTSSHEELIEETVRFLVFDGAQGGTSSFFFDLWAMAMRDEDAKLAVDHFYSRYRRLMAWLISNANPKIGGQAVELRAALIIAQIEGLMLFLNQDMPKHAELSNLADEAVREIMRCIRSPK
ncbi:MAG TPA: hypothetical protein DCE44_04775 [Verrucomicrobiales bacterium]|jgi:AcrR family transcriptional regulator|nr:hypothetical protein [Verrucomicrobiales bacterium]